MINFIFITLLLESNIFVIFKLLQKSDKLRDLKLTLKLNITNFKRIP